MTTPKQQAPLNIGFLGFDGVNGLDLAGPAEAFANASALAMGDAGGPAPYALHIIGLQARPFRTESGLTISPDCTLATAPTLDTLIVPGGAGLRDESINAQVVEWIKHHAAGTRRLASICTGVCGVAPTGLLDGRRVATHWRFAADVRRRFPQLKVDGDAIFTVDGKYFTSVGISSGIDLALTLIEQDLGNRLALAVAREMVVYLRRPGGQSQYSEPLRFQTGASDRLADLAAWIATHLDDDLSVEALANRVCLSPRQFRRCFADTFERIPAAFVEELRMSEARTRLIGSSATIERIATSVGFKSADVFRRAFLHKFGIAPADYRRGFGSISPSSPPTHLQPQPETSP